MRAYIKECNIIKDRWSVLGNLLTALIFVLVPILLAPKNLLSPGYLTYTDIVFPLDFSRFLELHTSTWFPYASFNSALYLLRIGWNFLFLPFGILFSMMTFTKFSILLPVLIAEISFYICFRHVLKLFDVGHSALALRFAGTVGAVVYAVNPFALGWRWTFSYSAYALLPLLFLSAIVIIQKPRLRYIIILSLLLFFSTVTPELFFFNLAFLTVTFLLFEIMNNPTSLGKAVINACKTVLVVTVLFMLISSLWVLPVGYTAISQIVNRGMITHPQIEDFGEHDIRLCSRTCSLSTAIRIVAGPRFLIEPSFVDEENVDVIMTQISSSYSGISNPGDVKDFIWIISSFIVPLVAFSSLLVSYQDKKSKTLVNILAVICLLGIFLSKGTSEPLGELYLMLFLKAPIISKFAPLFRNPSKFQFFTSFSMCMLYTISIANIIRSLSSKRFRSRFSLYFVLPLMMLLIVGSSAYFIYPVLKVHSSNIFTLLSVPDEYNDLNQWLKVHTKEKDVVLYLPVYPAAGYFPEWQSPKRIGPSIVWSLERDNINTLLKVDVKKELNDFQAGLIKKKYSQDLLKVFRYIIVDRSMRNRQVQSGKMISDAIRKCDDIESIKSFNFIEVYRVKNAYPKISISKSAGKPAEVISYKKINPALWKVEVDVSGPFVLSFAEAYDPLWIARLPSGKRIRSTCIDSVVNGFSIEKSGKYTVMLEYEPQKWFYVGLGISAMTLFSCLGYLVWDWRRRKEETWD